MSEEEKKPSMIKDTAEIVKGIVEAVPVYEDALQPLAKETGKALSTIGRAINVALMPLETVVWGFERLKQFLTEDLAAKLKNVPPERIITPDLMLAGPAVEALRYAGHNPDLREMYANLLARAMDSEGAHKAHPAFVEVLRQLTPDEARIIRLFLNSRRFPIWHLETALYKKMENGAGFIEQEIQLEYLSLVGYDAGCEHLDLIPSYINNLTRLGFAYLTSKQLPHVFRNEEMLKKPNPDSADPRLVEIIEKTPQVPEMLRRITLLDEKNYIQFWTRYMTVTPFGIQFCVACVMPPNFPM